MAQISVSRLAKEIEIIKPLQRKLEICFDSSNIDWSENRTAIQLAYMAVGIVTKVLTFVSGVQVIPYIWSNPINDDFMSLCSRGYPGFIKTADGTKWMIRKDDEYVVIHKGSKHQRINDLTIYPTIVNKIYVQSFCKYLSNGDSSTTLVIKSIL